MAIIGPDDLPSIIKVNSTQMKKYVLSLLGYPNVDVEISEDQFEVIWRVAGDFIARYFPHEQKLGLFYTSPLKPTYPLPKDAYWIQEVSWDPVSTRIDDVFGAESFLFCLSDTFKILDKDGKLQPLSDWKTNWKAKTPRGDHQLEIVDHKNTKQLPKLRVTYTNGIIEATSNHVIKTNDGWLELTELMIDHKLYGHKQEQSITNIEGFESTQAIGIRSPVGEYYGCTDGEPILLH